MTQQTEMTDQEKQAAAEQLAEKIDEVLHGQVNEVVWVTLMATLAAQINTAPAEVRRGFFLETVATLTDMLNAIA